MPYYLVTKPCKYVADGKPHYHRAGEIVELNDHVAAYLVRHIKVTKAPKSQKESVQEKYGALASYVDPLAEAPSFGVDYVTSVSVTDTGPQSESIETSKKGAK